MIGKIHIKKFFRRCLRIGLWIISGFIILSIGLSLLLLIPSVQKYVAGKATNFLTSKTNMKAKVGSIHIGFPKTIKIGEIYLEDQKEDTLFYCRNISINAELIPLIRGRFHIDYLGIEGVRGNVSKNAADSSFNFSPLIDVFSSEKPNNEKSKDWQLGFDEINLDDIDLSYFSMPDSTTIKLEFGHLNIQDNSSDISKKELNLKSIAIGQTSLSLIIGDKLEKVSVSHEAKAPLEIPIALTLNELDTEDIAFDLAFTSGKMELSALLKKANIKPKMIDLASQNISIDQIISDDIDVELNIKSTDSSKGNANIPSTAEQVHNYTFGNFDWNFTVGHSEISNTNYKMNLDEEKRLFQGMDYMHMDFTDFNVVVDNLFFNKNNGGATVSELSVKELSGPKIHDLKGIFFMDNQNISATNIILKTAESEAFGTVSLNYPALRLIGQEIQNLGITTELRGKISIAEASPFTSMIEDYPLLKQLGIIEFARFSTEGSFGDLVIKKAEISMEKSTSLKASGAIKGLPSSNIKLAYQIDTLITSGEDLIKILPDTLLPTDLSLPEKIALKSMGGTDFSLGNIKGDISTDFGNINFNAQLVDDNMLSNMNIDNFDVGALLQDTLFGKLNLQSEIEVKNIKNSLDEITSTTQLKSFQFNQFDYQNGTFVLNWTPDKTIYSGQLRDASLVAKIDGELLNRGDENHFNVSLEIDTADLQQLNITNEFFFVSGKLDLDMDIKSKDEFKGSITAQDIGLKKKGKSFYIDAIRFESDINEEFTNFRFLSEILDAELTGNIKLMEVSDAIVDHLDLYITLPDSIVNEKDYQFEFNLDLKKPSIITDFLVEDFDEIIIDRCHLIYNDQDDYLAAEVLAPRIEYKNVILDSLSLTFDSKGEKATSEFKLQSISYDSLIIHNLATSATFETNHANLSFTIKDLGDSLKYQLITDLNYEDSIYQFSIDPNNTIINYEKWLLPEQNFLKIANGMFYSENTELKNGDQSLALIAKDNTIACKFNNISLDIFTHIFDSDTLSQIFDGEANGHIFLNDPLRRPKLNGDINIPELTVMGNLLGNLQAKINQSEDAHADFDITLENKENLIYLAGTTSDTKNFNLILESDISNAATLQPLVSNYIDDLSGGVKGRLSIAERGNDININGGFDFSDFTTTIKPTNTQLRHNGQISIVDNMLKFNSFIIEDSLNNPFALAGTLDLSNKDNPVYNISLKTDEFLFINKQPVLDQPVYGKLNLGLDIDIKGRQSNLSIQSKIDINEKTDITYVMPGEDLELITDEGIVEFVDLEIPRDNSKDLAESIFIGDSLIALVKGINFSSNLNIDPNAKFRLILDPSSGDYSEFQIKGALTYTYNDIQRGVLNGLIEMEKGVYELSFYGLVKKQFNFDPGSTISWSGDVLDGVIDFSARHTVRTNSVGLVSNEISSYERAMYSQRLHYDVILKVYDRINQPTIAFEIDLPSRQRSTYPTLDTKLNILNQPNMEPERNKQVFALLVGGTFIPENPDVSEGSSNSNFATTAARNSVNAIMTQQLNKLTGQIIPGFDVDMGVNTVDDYSSGNAQTRTQLDVKVSKNLFNDRVSAEMESHVDLEGTNRQIGSQSTAGMSEFAVSYKLTESGRYRIKAFRENAYDFFDGEIQNSGLAFIFIREFDSFRKTKQNSSKNKKDNATNTKK